MLPERTQQKRIEEIELFIEYGVTKAEKSKALDLLKRYHNNPIALSVLLEFYKVLPETREEAVVKLAYVDSLQGITLLAVSTENHNYIAVVSDDEAHIIGEYAREEIPQEILEYFGHADNETFLASCGPVQDLQEYGSAAERTVCPVCQVGVGEYHVLGCPVEICPWCDSQLNRCNCRFEKLEVDSFETDEQVEEFQRMLEEKGRIPHSADNNPAYPGTSEGLDS